MKILRDTRYFYFSLLLSGIVISSIIFLVTGNNVNITASILNNLVFILLIKLCEEIINFIYKPQLENLRLYLFIFLFLSPLMQYNIILLENEYLAAFVFLFALFNYSLFEKNSEKIYLTLAVSGLIFSIYFYSYFVFASLPLMFFILRKSGYTGIAYFIIFIGFTVVMLINDFISLHFIRDWNVNNFFRSSFGMTSYNTVNFVFAFFPLMHPYFFVAGLLVLPFIRLEDFEEPVYKMAFIAFIINSLFIAGLPFQHFNMLIFSFPLLIIFLFPAFMRVVHLTEYFRPLFLKYLPWIIPVIQLALLAHLIVNHHQLFFNN